ncbi:hypothetical protein PAXRUDRAFT_827845 [Paxillus rubicundulus Ve08.2h10]|uniref:Uncharacterized protein n=1 Tax=Paxillus rubicundulus Ve08.2h10 TaxID=930991 RepID=A0A0D0E846_9AGAM|nr:hypothetical protein PAXRUDRAFT_827845 [Paxillus rubicundulus Ve08.2h10]
MPPDPNPNSNINPILLALDLQTRAQQNITCSTWMINDGSRSRDGRKNNSRHACRRKS